MGPEAENSFKEFVFANIEDGANYYPLVETFDEYFTRCTNAIHERAMFNVTDQGSTETAESYIRRLYKKEDRCQFGTMKDELLRDRILVGMHDRDLAVELQRQGKILTDVIAELRLSETVNRNAEVQKQKVSNTKHMNEVSREKFRVRGRSSGRGSDNSRSRNYNRRQHSTNQQKCQKCFNFHEP